VRAPRQQAQHASGIVLIAWLSQDRCIDHNYGIGTEHPFSRPALGDIEGFLAGQPLGAILRQLSRVRGLVDFGWLHGERNACTPQKFLSARRSGSEHDHGI
jgi:hypothetical protein